MAKGSTRRFEETGLITSSMYPGVLAVHQLASYKLQDNTRSIEYYFTTHAAFVFSFLADVESPELVSKLLVFLHRREGVELLGD